LGVGVLQVRAIKAQERPRLGNPQSATAKAERVKPLSRSMNGVILEPGLQFIGRMWRLRTR